MLVEWQVCGGRWCHCGFPSVLVCVSENVCVCMYVTVCLCLSVYLPPPAWYVSPSVCVPFCLSVSLSVRALVLLPGQKTVFSLICTLGRYRITF